MTMSCLAKVKGINYKTTAKMFKNLKVGDLVKFSCKVEAVGGNRGTYATNIRIENMTTEEVAFKTFNEVGRIMDYFEWEEFKNVF